MHHDYYDYVDDIDCIGCNDKVATDFVVAINNFILCHCHFLLLFTFNLL